MDNLEELKTLYKLWSGDMPVRCERLTAQGGDRVYYRMYDAIGGTVIGVCGDSERDCHAFIELSERFKDFNVPVPEIYAVSLDYMQYIEQDLGDTSLYNILGTADGEKYVADALSELAYLHSIPAPVWDRVVAYKPWDKRLVMWDLNYFKYEFLKPTGVQFDEELLEDDFERLAKDLTELPNEVMGFMYRDCQSRNVMVHDNQVWWIDYQGGRRGPILYDVVSFLWQVRAGFSDGFRAKMLDHYAEVYCELKHGEIDKETLLAPLGLMRVFRGLQTLGAYGFRGLVEHRAQFVTSIPGALRNLRAMIEDGLLANYPELEGACKRVIEAGRFGDIEIKEKAEKQPLTVKVFSFSYKKGYPEDLTGNGGGFMFDCRGMHNPGRYDEYKPLTGRDKPVIDFLEDRGEVQEFVDNALRMVCPTIERYSQRGFESLQIGFGCTGGRHRSVYCAQRMARELAERYPGVRVELTHREQGIRETITTQDKSR